MAQSVLVFISHSSDDKETLVEPIVQDLENCYINVWLDKKKILPGDNLRQSIFREGLDKADIALIFFTEKSLKSSWVDKEIKHVLREETKRGNDFDLKKIISIFDSEKTYQIISERYPELTDDLLHLMPVNYDKIQLGQLISAIWSKYLSLQGGSIEIKRQLLQKDQEILKKDKEIYDLNRKYDLLRDKKTSSLNDDEFKKYYESGKLKELIDYGDTVLKSGRVTREFFDVSNAVAFGLMDHTPDIRYLELTQKGKDFLQWILLNK